LVIFGRKTGSNGWFWADFADERLLIVRVFPKSTHSSLEYMLGR